MRRVWVVEPDEDLNEAFLEAAAVMYRLGGSLSIVAARKQISETVFLPDGVQFLWESYAPARKAMLEEEEPDASEEYADVEDLEPAPSG
jgi:hypothetical protein